MRTLTEKAAAVASGEVSPVELVEQSLKEIDRVQPVINAFTHVLAEDALADAKDLEGREPVGPLHGVPIAIKDLYDVAGVPTSGCCGAYRDRLAVQDSPVVAKLRSAGAIVIAKTNMHELAFGATTQVSCFGPALNPWNTARIPGGSSGGSGAAVGAGVVTMAMGSDTGGSIRIPSALCGVTGLKPTHGAVSLRGALPMTASFDTGGPLAVSAVDCLLCHELIAGPDTGYLYSAEPPASLPVPISLVLGVPTLWLEDIDPEMKTSVERTAGELGDLGYTVREIDGPDPSTARADVYAVLVGEFAHHYRDLWDDERVSPSIRDYMNFGKGTSAADYARGREAALALRLALMQAFESVDVLLTPAVPGPAPEAEGIDHLAAGTLLTRFTLPANAAGLPALAFPIGFSSDGLPLGGQLIGRHWSESVLCSIGDAYQAATDWHLQRALVS
jgi:aspartyl-tRNA(Asn)/glutamyl-tRNA(Gln) amidotransferase subunit A